MRKNALLKLLAFAAVGLVTFSASALAGSSADWLGGADDGLSSLTESLVTIGGNVVALGIVGYGVWGALNQRLEMRVMLMLFLSAALIALGSTIGPGLIEMFGSGS